MGYLSHRHKVSVAEQVGSTTGNTWTSGEKRWQGGSFMGLQSLTPCTQGRRELNSHRSKRYVDVLSILSELSLRERLLTLVVCFLARDGSLETGRGTEKKGGKYFPYFQTLVGACLTNIQTRQTPEMMSYYFMYHIRDPSESE